MDGGGAQIHRKLAIFSLAKNNGFGYIDSPLIGVITPSYSPDIEYRKEILDSWNALTKDMHSSEVNLAAAKKFIDPKLSLEFFNLVTQYHQFRIPFRLSLKHLVNFHFKPGLRLIRRCQLAQANMHFMRIISKFSFFLALLFGRNCVLIVTEPFDVIKHGDDYVHNSKSWTTLQGKSIPLKIGVHVRRGDLSSTDVTRYLPDEYYKEVLNFVITLLKSKSIAYELIYYVDFPRKNNNFEDLIDPSFWNFALINEPFTVNIEADSQALKSLSSSDLIIGSKSSYSFVAGLISKAWVILPKWWIENPSDWITVELNDSRFPILEK